MAIDSEREEIAGSDRSAGASKQSADFSNLPALDFSTFLLSLSTTAFCQLGLVAEPGSSQMAQPDLILAKQTIDTLEMLRAKTRGNLDQEEIKLFDSLLYELRLRFVETGK